MVIIDLNKQFNLTDRYIIGLGNFDGLHLGHQNLIKDVIKYSRFHKLKSSMLIFKNHTKDTLLNNKNKVLLSLDEKLEILEKFGIECVFICDFNAEMMYLSANEFVSYLSNILRIKAIVVGNDYKFAYKGQADIRVLSELAAIFKINVFITDTQFLQSEIISSTGIRYAIENGNIDLANKMLGYPYFISGEVLHGKGVGKNMGFPTANLAVSENKILPSDGVYITKTSIDDTMLLSCTSIGHNPTFKDYIRSIETHILDYNDDLYSKNIKIYFYKKLRDQISFKSINELHLQIEEDIKKTKDFFSI